MTIEMWLTFVQDVLFSREKVALLIISLSLAMVSLLVSYKSVNPRRKLILLRMNMFFLFAPLIFIALTWECGMSLLSCEPMKILVSLPVTILVAYLAGNILLPLLYTKTLNAKPLNHMLINKLTKILGTKPHLYSIDKQEPVAFAKSLHKPSIYISIGLLDLMTRKELEAVLLHEAYHIKVRSPELKFSSIFSKFFSPLSWLCNVKADDELEADEFAISVQGTSHHIKNARKKINSFYKNSNKV